MMTPFKHFNPKPETLEELKKFYKNLAFRYHPDMPAGDAVKMKELNAEYDLLFPRLKDIRANSKGETFTDKKPTNETPEVFKNIINKIIHLEGLKIEIIGSFIWLSENTRPYKDLIKALGFRWSQPKLSWYLPPEGYKKNHNKSYTLDDIRHIFGYQEIENELAKKIS